jgi:hypothetical protein
MNRALTILTALGLAGVATAQVTPFPMDGSRAATGLFFFDRTAMTSPGQIFLHYGAPEWNEDYDKYLGSDKAETLRLGKDWWATLDATLPLTLGQTKVASGIYYLGLHKTDKGQWQLMLLDPKEVRKKKAHPGMTPALTAALNVDLSYRKFDKSADKLSISIKSSKSDPSVGSMVIHWGNHLLQAPVKAHLGAKKAAEAAGKKGGEKAGKKQ